MPRLARTSCGLVPSRSTPTPRPARITTEGEFVAEAGPGDFIYVPPFVPHQEINANHDEPLSCVVVRNDQEPIVVNLDIRPAESPEEAYWVDPAHPHP